VTPKTLFSQTEWQRYPNDFLRLEFSRVFSQLRINQKLVPPVPGMLRVVMWEKNSGNDFAA
jgi:hypothetical protein